MVRRPLVILSVLLCLAGATACRTMDLSKSLQVTDILSGYYDAGIKNGKNHLVPMLTFRLKNVGTSPINSVQLTVSFWHDGADGELDSVLIQGIGSTSVAPGQSTEPITVRATTGYTLEQPRADLFTHSEFKDFTAKFFAKRSGAIHRLGDFKVERRLIPHQQARAAHIP